MTEIILEETELAFNYEPSQDDSVDTNGFSAIQHEFRDAPTFPVLSEWSRYSAHKVDSSFEGIVFKNHDYKPYVTITMDKPQTGFKNIFGKYVVDENGYMHSANILAHNTRGIEKGHQVSFVHSDTQNDLQFFLIANGYSYNKNINSDGGDINFVYGFGTQDERVAKITDDPSTIDLIYTTQEADVKLTGPIYHTSNPQLNYDGKGHSISGLINEGDTNILRIGFEDFPNLGDGDFNDLIFDVEIAYIPPDSIMAIGLNNIVTASGNDDIFLKDKDANDPLLEDGFSPNNLYSHDGGNDIFAQGDLKNINDEEHTEESLEILISMDNVLQSTDSQDLAIANFVSTESSPIETVPDANKNYFAHDVLAEQDNIITLIDIV